MSPGTYLVTQACYELILIPNDYRINWTCLKCTNHGVVITIISSGIDFPYVKKVE